MNKLVVSVSVLVAVVLTGCGFLAPKSDVPGVTGGNSLSDKVGKELGEQMAEEMLGGIDVEFAEEGSGDVVAWPKQIPSDVPEFKYGKIDASMATPGGEADYSVMMQFREVEKEAYAKYEQDLVGAGWTITTDSDWSGQHISAEKDGAMVDIDKDPVGENTAFLYYFPRPSEQAVEEESAEE